MEIKPEQVEQTKELGKVLAFPNGNPKQLNSRTRGLANWFGTPKRITRRKKLSVNAWYNLAIIGVILFWIVILFVAFHFVIKFW